MNDNVSSLFPFQLEQGPNTMHREHKRNSQKDLNDPNTNNKSKTQNSFSAEARLHHNRNNNKQDGPGKKQRESPYSKSSVNSLEDKRKEIFEELTAFRKKYNSTRPPNFTNSNNGNTTSSSSSKNEIADRLKTSPASNNSKGSNAVISPRKTKSLSPNLRRRCSNILKTPPSAAILTTEDKLQQQQQQQLKTADKTRSGTTAATAIPVKSKTEKMDLEHQRLMRAKKIALEALKVKKNLMPYR